MDQFHEVLLTTIDGLSSPGNMCKIWEKWEGAIDDG